VITGSIQYLDVGIKLEVEPQVYADGDVGLKLNLEVSSLGAPAKNDSGAFQIGTRSTQTVLRLKDGETQILGGLIQDGDRNSGSRIPGLGEVPLLTRLFGNDNSNRSKSELIVSITPRVVRPVSLSDPSQNNIWSGSEAAVRNKPIRVDPIGGVKFNEGRAVGATGGASVPALPSPAAGPVPAAVAPASVQRGGATAPPTPPAFAPAGGEAPAALPAGSRRPVLRPGMGIPGSSIVPRTMPGRVPAAEPAPVPAPEPEPEPTPADPEPTPEVPGTPSPGASGAGG
jgi:general secretion pathway protein D